MDEIYKKLEMLYREAKAVADDHHRPRYARLDEALESVEEFISNKSDLATPPESKAVDEGVREAVANIEREFDYHLEDVPRWNVGTVGHSREQKIRGYLKTLIRAATRNPSAAVEGEVIHALEDAASVFRNYEQLHLAKEPPDKVKAIRNAYYAKQMEDALTTLKKPDAEVSA